MDETKVLKKLKLSDQNPVLIINYPKEYQKAIDAIQAEIHHRPQQEYAFVHVFVKNLEEIERYAELAVKRLDGDGYLWFSYPKKSSKKYKSNVSRDLGWKILGKYDFEPVTQISIDDNWSALRFRHVDNIKTMTRSKAISDKGKKRINSKL